MPSQTPRMLGKFPSVEIQASTLAGEKVADPA
jgi:hypothetical protein